MSRPPLQDSVGVWTIPVCADCGRQPFRNAHGTDWLCVCNPYEHGGHPAIAVRWVTVVEKDTE